MADEAGITFCFARSFHPSMAHAAVARSELGIGTAFNFLGPLTNPARPTYAVVGCADARMAPLMAGVFAGRGTDAAVFRGDDGLDEVTVSTTTSVLVGDDAEHNAGVVRRLLEGETGPVRDAVLLNAGLGLAVAGARDGGGAADHDAFVALVADGVERARRAIDDGHAARVLQRWITSTSA